MSEKKILFLIPVVYVACIVELAIWGRYYLLSLSAPFSSALFGIIFLSFMAELALIGALGISALVGIPPDSKKTERELESICFVDKAGFPPVLLSKKKEGDGITMEFFSAGIPLAEYKKRSEEIETALNIRIVLAEYHRDMRHVVLKALSGKVAKEKKKMILWDNKMLSDKDFELVLGETNFNENESVDIAVTPHILIGGGSGSGKSKLLKLMLMQCIRKGALVYLSDFKGGVDYPLVWHKCCNIITNAERLKCELDAILSALEERRNRLIETQTANIGEYNEKTGSHLPRMIVACDEVAEVLDKTGLDKDEKALVGQIEAKLSTVARLGRAFGIHLIFATQRPDADILKGQIKNNIGYRVCGRADKVLSQIILDNTEGAEQIAQEDQGMFLTNNHTIFKAYYMGDDCLEGFYGAEETGTEG